MNSKEYLLRKMVDHKDARDKYIEQLPSDIQAAFFDNGYVDALNKTVKLLIHECFGDDAESVVWFLYKWRPGDTIAVQRVLHQIWLRTIDDYIQFMKDYGLEDWNENTVD